MVRILESTDELREIWWNDGDRGTSSHRKKKAVDLHRKNRPFVAWDGEGITYPGNSQQAYILFAASTGDYTVAKDGACLTTEQCLGLLFRVEEQIPDAYHVGFGFGYDVNQILNSFSRRDLYALSYCTKSGRSLNWHGFRIKIHPGKMFRVSRGDKEHGTYRVVTVYDTFSFFQRRFLDVVKAYFPGRLGEITSGKTSRGSFEYSSIYEIIKYCLAENDLLVKIMERLRDNLEERELYLRDWYGPGAIASASLKKYNVRAAMGKIPAEVSGASRLAYQGGRFELLRAGYYGNRVWEYDVNSAYPSAIAKLPDLSKGNWEYTDRFESDSFGVWNIKYRDSRTDRYDRYSRYSAQPLFHRDKMGRITYPANVEGWYWTPEAENIAGGLSYPGLVELIGGWVFRPATDNKPFKHIPEIYLERQELKKQGLGGLERVVKLELNSYYGKFAQRSGWFKQGDRIPSYHQLEWAGYITSYTRAMLYKLYLQNPRAIIAFETDAIFSDRDLGIPTGNGLGEYSLIILEDLLYIQSGFYFAHNSDGSSVEHYRGFDKGSITFNKCFDWLDKLDPRRISDKRHKLHGTSKRFIGFKRALTSRNPHYWRQWDTSPREITIGQDGKRVHMPGCPQCRQKAYKWTDGMHWLVTPFPGGKSNPHKIPWMDQLDEWDMEDELAAADGYSS